MSKKQPFTILNDNVEAATTGASLSPPQLFSRRLSKGAPFIINDGDNPYEKRAFGHDYAGQRYEAAARARASTLTGTLSGLGINSRATRTGKLGRRIMAVGLVVAIFLLSTYAKAVPKYLPAVPSAIIPIPSLKRAFWYTATESIATSQGGHKENGQNGLHTFHPNGLLLVNPRGRHPIHVLIEKAEKKWATLLGKQSSTLDEATQEYKRRYKRNPPQGWEHWWHFTQQNKVILVDEYDQVSRDFEPFWALEPQDIRHRNKVMQERDHTFTLSIKDGKVTRHGEHADIERASDMGALLERFAEWIPGEVNMTFVIDDSPAVMMGWNQKERMLELARQGDYWGASEFLAPEDPSLSNFAKSCPPNSPLRRAEEDGMISSYTSTDAERSFIYDHAKAVNLCSHPEFQKLHGHTASGGISPGPLVPLFTWAKTQMHSDVLVTPLEQYDDDYLIYDPPFENKARNKLMWRGSTTGTEFREGYPWEQSQRARMHFMGAERGGKREVMWSDHGNMLLSNATSQALNKAYMDVKFSGQPAQCDPETCEKMRRVIDFAPTMGLEEQNQYRYLMDIDGNGWSGRFHRLLSTNSVVLKSTVFPEWYQDQIVPWVHYVPVKVDYSDVYDIMAFFTGNPDGRGAHEGMAKRIGEQGKQFAKQHWRREDMAAYMFRLVLEYARLLHQDEDTEIDYFAERF